MKKIPTLYVREFEKHKIKSIDTKPIPEMAWVEKGEGIATVKVDGACVSIINGEFYKRFDAKEGKTIPEGAILCQEKGDEVTGHLPCWVKCDRSNPSDKWFWDAYDNTMNSGASLDDGTYEAVGEKFQNNAYQYEGNFLEKHGSRVIEDLPTRDFKSIKQYLEQHNIEGIVFWKEGEPQCKIKRSDFGLEWNKNVKKSRAKKQSEIER